MLDRATVDRLRAVDATGAPVVSVYLGLAPGPEQIRAIPARLKALIAPLRERAEAGEYQGEGARRLRADLDAVLELGEELSGDLGRGAAMFVSTGAGIREYVSLPAGVRDRAVVNRSPYLGPLEAMLDHFRRYCAVVVDRRTAEIFRFYMGSLESWEVIAEEEVRKDNYGGFAGYAEQRVRGHAETVARRLFRTVSDRLVDLKQTGEFDLLAVGGNQANVDGLVAELSPALRERLGGTFVVDPRTATPADIRERCSAVAAEHDRRIDQEQVDAVRELAGSGGRALLGLDRVLDAVNQKAVDRLLVAASEAVPGVRCTTCGWLSTDKPLCPACGEATSRVADLVDAAAEATRETGGSVRYLVGDVHPEDFEVAATVRFPVPEVSH